MNKLLLPLMLVFTLSILGESSILLKAGGSFNGNFNKDYWEETTKTSLNYQGAFELLTDINSFITIGFGSGYYEGATLEKIGSESAELFNKNMVFFNSVPVYVTGQCYIPIKGIIKPYIKINYGYSYNIKSELAENLNVDIESDDYYGAGFGVEVKSLILEVLYEVNEAGVLVDGELKQTDYRRISAFVGIKF